MNKQILLIIPIVLVIMLLGVSCSEKEEKDTIPEMPPAEALFMDFNEFIENPSQVGALKSLETYQNATYSYFTVWAWNTLATIPMIVPVLAYLESFNHTPVYLGGNSWQWSYSWSGAETYSARLVTTRISNEEFTAEMFITKVGDYEDFKWFEGTLRYDRTYADWTMYHSPQQNVEWLNIEWNKDWEEEVSDITYTVVQAGHQEYGSYITFGITDDLVYDAYYTISHSQRTTRIEWNLTTGAGRVKDQVTFMDNEWHCWNELYQDIVCP
jgi:hypothetical protein